MRKWIVITEGFRPGNRGQDAKVDVFDSFQDMLRLRNSNLPLGLTATAFAVYWSEDVTNLFNRVEGGPI